MEDRDPIYTTDDAAGESALPLEHGKLERVEKVAGSGASPIGQCSNPDSQTALVSDDFFPVDARTIQAERIVGLITCSVVATAVIVGLAFAAFKFGFTWPFFLLVALGIGLLALLFLAAYQWPAWSHNRTSYRVDESGLEIRRGVIWRHRMTVPLGRVQHADVSQGPIQRLFGIATLTVHTAGTQNASIGLVGLEHGVAERIRDLIVHQRRGHDAV